VSRAALERRVLDVIGAGAHAALDDAEFDALALALFRHQYRHNEPYRRICAAYGIGAEAVHGWRDVPAVPTGAFKEARLASFPIEREVRVFKSSGTTGERRSALHLDTLEIYRASVLATFGAYICPEAERLRFMVLAPSSADAPDSSLSCMFDMAVQSFGTPSSRFCVTHRQRTSPSDPSGWDPERVCEELARLDEPVVLAGTAFAFVHLLDALEAARRRLQLPPGSRVMETGGFKGQSRELTRDELHGGIERALGVGRERIVNQYGMCELGSQFYEATLLTGAPSTIKRVPPWVRTRAVDPETLRDVPPGESGVLVHYDLANTGSVLAVQTSDEGRLCDDGFEVLGRLRGAEPRGCSIAADALLRTA
jgi:phenylacetate-coenzyme A ligase PaaK-like adenylate-forming protein